MSQGDVVAIVLDWHDSERTAACTRRLQEHGRVDHIVVVHNEDPDGDDARALQTAGGVGTSVSVPENRGFSGGVNVGLRLDDILAHAYVLVINNDAYVEPGAVERMAAHLDQHPRVAVAGPRLLNGDGSVQSLGGIVHPLTWRVTQRREPGPFDYLSWACVLIRTAALEDVGLLDEGYFMYWEDADFARRVRAQGWELGVVTDSHVVHELSASRARAGSRLSSYYAAGLLRYAACLPAWNRATAVARVLTILAKRVALRDREGAVRVVHASRSSRSSGPAYLRGKG